MQSTLQISLKRLKQQAKKLAANENIPHTEALERVARDNKFPNWKAVLAAADVTRVKSRKVTEANTRLPEYDIPLPTEQDRAMPVRGFDLPEDTKLQLHGNISLLVSLGIEFAIFEPTETGLKKKILDATSPVRALFEIEGLHSFASQGQGEEHKVIKTVFFITAGEVCKSKVSLYRPMTKKGDPRMWFTDLASFASIADQVAIIVCNDALYLVNLSRDNLKDMLGGISVVDLAKGQIDPPPPVIQQELAFSPSSEKVPFTPLASLISQYLANKNSLVERLLAQLREIAKHPIPANKIGDTAVGMAVEQALGILANSSKSPDFESRIEIKSGRMSKNRSTLFAQVPDWSHPRGICKSSAEILKRYGYERGTDFKLYCTVSATKVNSQGLSFECNLDSDLLLEKDASGNVVAAWPGSLLRDRLTEKHQETFWINARSTFINGQEYFQLLSVTHTKKPVVARFLELINMGVVTMDHLIKKTGGEKQRVSEKGPLFKMDKRDLPLLFPTPLNYDLTS